MFSVHHRKLIVSFVFSTFLLLQVSASSPESNEWRPEKLGQVLESTLVRYYLFDLKNPEEFENGAEPEVEEIGPFTYREKRVKESLKRTSDRELNYDIRWSMHHLPELTGKGLNEKTEFTTLNVPYVTMAEGLSNLGFDYRFNDIIMEEIVEAGEKLYRQGIKFGDSTFHGYNVSLYTNILDELTNGQTEQLYPELANGKFAFFKNKNGTVTANYTVLSTKRSPFGRILKFNGSPSLGFWPPHSDCDDASGSFDLFTFPKDIQKNQEYHVLFPDNCRSMRLRFTQEDVFRGIPVYTFTFPLDQFRNDLSDKKWGCYCLNYANMSDPMCLEDGFLDYSGCSKGAPLVGSFPHFLHASPKHLIKGLSPNISLHESEVTVEPITGTPLYAVRRFQINLRVHPLSTVTQFANITERIFPLAWVEHILEVPSSVFADVKEKLEKMRNGAKLLSDEEKYQNEQDNSVYTGRSGFPTSSSDENSENKSTAENTAANEPASRILCFFAFIVLFGSYL